MPSSKSSAPHPLPDLWPPTQVLLQPTVAGDNAEIEDLDLARMNEDPLLYFLTPTAPSCGADGGDVDFEMEMEFDAGIEDAKHPHEIVRSVSPSSLGGFGLPPARPPTPPRSPATPDLDTDLSATPDEQYDYMLDPPPTRPAGALNFPRRLKDLATGKRKGHPEEQQPEAAAGSPGTLAPPAVPHSPRAPSVRGRAATRAGPPKPIATNTTGSARARRTSGTTMSSSRLSPHAWREPSPDVWSIEEETEEELKDNNSEMMGASSASLGRAQAAAAAEAVDIPAAKPKKRVRFVLPAREDDRHSH